MIVGIDFGTCFSHVSVIMGETVIDDLVRDSGGFVQIPSKFIINEGKEYFGSEAEKVSRICKREPLKEIKLKVRGKEYLLKKPYGEGESSQTYGDILSKLLGYIIDCVKRSDSDPIEYITVAAPVSLNKGGIQNTEYNNLLKETIKTLTGLDDEHVFVKEEPVVAAHSYICNSKPQNDESILVFDLGGGTLDISIVRYTKKGGEMKVVSTGGEEIGGNKWSARLATIVKASLFKEGVSEEQFPPNYNDEIEKLKIRLSSNAHSPFYLTLNDGSNAPEIVISRAEFEFHTEELLKQCESCVNDRLEEAGMRFDDIDSIVLVGGGSLMPQVRRMFLGNPGVNDDKIKSYSPDTAISNGAALFAKNMVKQSGVLSVGPYIKETSSHSYGVEVDDTYYGSSLVKNIIFKGEEFIDGNLYRSPGCTFKPGSDGKTQNMLIKIYESDCLKSECDEKGYIRISKNTVPVGKPISIPVPEGYRQAPSRYKIRIALNLTSDKILRIRVTEATEDGRVLMEGKINS